MKKPILSVYDVASNCFGQPVIVVAVGEGMRSFCDACADDKSAFGAHPEDYSLFEIGSFDDQSGDLKDIVNRKVVTGLEAKIVGGGNGELGS